MKINNFVRIKFFIMPAIIQVASSMVRLGFLPIGMMMMIWIMMEMMMVKAMMMISSSNL